MRLKIKELIDDVALYRQFGRELDDLVSTAQGLLDKRLHPGWQENDTCVLVMGALKSGKSSVVNSIAGDSLCGVDELPLTAECRELVYRSGSAHQPQHKETQYTLNFGRKIDPREPLKGLNQRWKGVRLMDTPGYLSPGFEMQELRKRLQVADMSLVVLDASRSLIPPEEMELIRSLRSDSSKGPVYLYLNLFWVEPKRRTDMVRHFQSLYRQQFEEILPGTDSGEARLLQLVLECKKRSLRSWGKREQVLEETYREYCSRALERLQQKHSLHVQVEAFFRRIQRELPDRIQKNFSVRKGLSMSGFKQLLEEFLESSAMACPVDEGCQQFVLRTLTDFVAESHVIELCLGFHCTQSLLQRALSIHAQGVEELAGLKTSASGLQVMNETQLETWILRVLRHVLIAKVQWCQGWYHNQQYKHHSLIQKVSSRLRVRAA